MCGGSHSGVSPLLDGLRARFLKEPYPKTATHENWKEFKKRQKAAQPVAYWFLETAPRWIDRRLYRFGNGIWAILHRVHPRHRYHVVKTDLKPGYYDIDTLMLHTNMALLVRYVEDEMGGIAQIEERARWLSIAHDPNAPPEWNDHSDEINSLHDIKAIYIWWKQYQYRQNEIWELPPNASWMAEQQLANEEDEMLIKLIKLRHGMWT
jgi:hypothetical protein